MKNVLIIGGSGTWSGKTYIPSIKNSDKVKLVAIMDSINPYFSEKTIQHFDFLEENKVKWIRTAEDCNADLLKKCIIENDIDIAIVSTPPKFHFEYTLLLLSYGVDIICDKPIIATKAQSSLLESAMENIKKYNALLEAIQESHNRKKIRRCFVLTPLRRRFQTTYTGLFESLQTIKNEFSQEVSRITISHNDGVFRFYDEVEIKCGSHGYSDGFGKLTHTGFHILDLVAALIEYGCFNENIQCSCKIINCTTVGEMLSSNGVNAKLLRNQNVPRKVSDIALQSEMDLAICYTLYRNGSKFCNIMVDLIHCGKSNRIQHSYNFDQYNDQGRTNELTLHIQQGSLFSIQMILNTSSGTSGTIGNGYTFKNYHPKVAEKMNVAVTQVLNFEDQLKEGAVDILPKFYDLISQNDLGSYYACTDFLKQKITNELYISALIAKVSSEEYKWELGKM